MKLLTLLFPAVMLLAACTTPAPASDARIVSTTSFGMCVGYCSTRLEIAQGQAVLTRSARGDRGGSALPDQRFTAALTPAEWQQIAGLAASTSFSGLPATIGCPDCADGGAESLSVDAAGQHHEVAFEHGANIPQVQALLDRVRALRARLTPAT